MVVHDLHCLVMQFYATRTTQILEAPQNWALALVFVRILALVFVRSSTEKLWLPTRLRIQ